MTPELLFNLRAFLPELILLGTLILLFAIDAAFPKSRENQVPLVVLLVACVAGAIATCTTSKPELYKTFFSGLVANDSFTAFFRYLFFFACATGAYLAFGSKEILKKSRMEYALLLVCVTFGMCTMAMSTHLLSLYIAIETVSIVSFVLAGFNRDEMKSNEASLKYLIFGALSSGAMVYGFSLVYGYTGSLQYAEIGKYFAAHATETSLAMTLAMVLIYAGLAYKISAFPMHFWAPDVYEGSPTPVASFFSIGPKAAGFAALIRFTKDVMLVPGAPGTETQWQVMGTDPLLPAIAVVAALTMVVGNLSAIGQTSTKRLLAYSSIAHVGYMLMGLLTLNEMGVAAILFYLVCYCAMNLGAFWVISVITDVRGSDELDAFRGMGWKMPVLGTCMAIFLFSLTGIPLFAGFIGKFLLFTAVLKTPGFLWIALFAVLNSVVSLYYYAKILKVMWLDTPEDGLVVPRLSVYHAIGIVGLAIPTVVLGLFWGPLLRFATASLATIL